MNRFKKFVFDGLLLSIVSLIMRAIGVSFNVYISNTVGPETMGLFTLIFTVYGFAITFATSGINLGATRLVSEALGELSSVGISYKNGKTPSVRAVMRQCTAYSLFFGILAGTILFLFAPTISIKILHDERCISSLKLLSITLPSIALSSALSGYFTAVRRVYKNAISQVAEQFIKILACVFLLSFFFAKDVESACLCIVAGGVIAELLSFVIQWLTYIFEREDISAKSSSAPPKKTIKSKLLGISIPIALSAYLRSGLVTIEHILIPWGLERSGASRKISLAAYGTVHSMVFPIIFFPSSILASFAGLLVPEISQSIAEKKPSHVKRIVSNVFETALIFSIGVSGIMMFFSYELGNLIYPSSDAGKYIRMIAPLIPVMYADTAIDAMLKGLGEQVYSMGVNIIDSLLSVILVIILLPRFGINGYIMTVYFTELINATLSITRLLCVTEIKPYVFTRVFKPLGAIILSCISVNLLTRISPNCIFSGMLGTIVSISLTAGIYTIILIAFGALKLKKIGKGLKLLKN